MIAAGEMRVAIAEMNRGRRVNCGARACAMEINNSFSPAHISSDPESTAAAAAAAADHS